MKNRRSKLWISFHRNERGAVALIFALAIIPVLYFVGTAIDYSSILRDRSLLQTGTDQAALTLATNIGQYYLTSNGGTPQSATLTGYQTQANGILASATRGFGSVASNYPMICPVGGSACNFNDNGATVTLQPGQVKVKASGTQSRLFGNVLGEAGVPISTVSTAQTNVTPSPATLNFTFDFAKGWDFKIITLYAVSSATNAQPFALATWTYQAKNTNVVATPAASLLYFNPNNVPVSDTGMGLITSSYASTTYQNADGSIDLSKSKDSSGNSFAQYSNLYLTMQVGGECPPGESTSTSNYTNASDIAAITAMYANISRSFTENLSCSGSMGSTSSLTSYSTNSPANSNFLWINGVEQPNNVAINVGAAFPCASSGATGGGSQTTYYEWEDSNTSSSGTRDYFFHVTTTCSTNNWVKSPVNSWLTN